MSTYLPPIICIGGPTGAGKSAAACYLAAKLDGVVLNADSRQVYADFPIITAQPGAGELARCEHRLYGFLPSENKISAGEYLRLAAPEIENLSTQGKIPIIVGGTGLYFRALLRGIAQIPPVEAAIHQHWQQRCAAEGSPALHSLLRERDPEYAAKIHPNDRQRITRALEVHDATGRTFSWWHRESGNSASYQEHQANSHTERPSNSSPGYQAVYPALFLGVSLPLGELEPLLARRIELMLAAGALEEANKARQNCDNPATPGWSGIGCAELYRHLTGEISLDACRELWLRNTRAYAKRQLTWFKAEQDFLPHRPGQEEAMLRLARDWLTKQGHQQITDL